MVAHPVSRQVRPALYAFDGRSFPEIGCAATDPSDMPNPTGLGGSLFLTVLDFFERPGYALDQGLRDPVSALLADDDPQLGLEVVSLEAGRAVVEVALDQEPPVVGELSVEVVVQQLHR